MKVQLRKHALATGFTLNGRFYSQQTTGVQSFARSVSKELQGVAGFQIVIPPGTAMPPHATSGSVISYGSLKGHAWEQVSLPRFVKHNGKLPLLNLCNTAPVSLTNQVVVIHDLAFMKNPAWFHPAFAAWYRWLIPKIVRKSKAVITVSNFVKEALQEHFKLPEQKLFVTSNKVSEAFLQSTPVPLPEHNIQPGNFFLMVGTNDPRKNFGFVIQLFSKCFPNVQLVIAGGSNRNFRNNSGALPANVVQTGYTSEGQLAWLYSNAIAFINPSLYEGFGIPNLEAFSRNCPVICSDIPVFREVCRNAATFFPPRNEAALEAAVQKLLLDKSVVQQQQMEGKTIFTSFQTINRTSVFINAIAV